MENLFRLPPSLKEKKHETYIKSVQREERDQGTMTLNQKFSFQFISYQTDETNTKQSNTFAFALCYMICKSVTNS
jgi:hypothetical protein